MPTHRLHLKGPWEVRRLDRDEPARRVVLPASWQTLFGAESGRAEFRRKFNQPTNLESHEHVWVVFDGIHGEAAVRINRKPLGQISPTVATAEFEITQQLVLHNELVVELSFVPDADPAQPGGLWGPVALEIRFDENEVPDETWTPAFRAT